MVFEIQKRNKGAVYITAPTSTSVDADGILQKMEPIYEDIEFSDKTGTINFPKNVAYVCTKK